MFGFFPRCAQVKFTIHKLFSLQHKSLTGLTVMTGHICLCVVSPSSIGQDLLARVVWCELVQPSTFTLSVSSLPSVWTVCSLEPPPCTWYCLYFSDYARFLCLLFELWLSNWTLQLHSLFSNSHFCSALILTLVSFQNLFLWDWISFSFCSKMYPLQYRWKRTQSDL